MFVYTVRCYNTLTTSTCYIYHQGSHSGQLWKIIDKKVIYWFVLTGTILAVSTAMTSLLTEFYGIVIKY